MPSVGDWVTKTDQSTRKFSRFCLGAPVFFQWCDAQGVTQQGTGFTRDISAGGIYLVTRAPIHRGVSIQFEAQLPSPLLGTQLLRMQGEGRVTRVDPEAMGDEWNGVAALNTSVALWDTQRRFQRQPVEIPVRFFWREKRGRRRGGEGFARDLTPGGFFLVTRDLPPAGVTLEFEAFLPAMSPEAPSLRMQGMARVVRMEKQVHSNGKHWHGIAAATETVFLHDFEQ